jgi:hypothetical protein
MDYPNDVISIVALVVAEPNTGLPKHQTAIPYAFSSGKIWHYYLSREI